MQPPYPELLHAPVLHMPVVVLHAVPFGHKFVSLSQAVQRPVAVLHALPPHDSALQAETQVPLAPQAVPLGHKFATLSQATHRPVAASQIWPELAQEVCVHKTQTPLSHEPLGHKFVVSSQATHRPVVASQILPAHEAEVHGAAASGLPLRPAAITRTIKTIASAAITRIMYTGAHKILATSSGRPQQTRRAESSVFRARAGAHQEQGPPSDRKCTRFCVQTRFGSTKCGA